MDAETFRAWRQRQGLTQDEAAQHLGLKRRMIQYYERGERGGRHVAIPKHVRLACWAISQGIRDFDGQEAGEAKAAS
ncbi:helix-turn-helix domain-containing protein [Pleomorphomonas oryzae]|uniref:helix-turn-helix domain-containing protein n=1 Tax=Pleomorphomonas oryzae TaxID=261934 RepID=UPI0004199099|nr:helix-turn-helix transcriptional regulator [Pleomorphomonas oryzae]